MWVYMGFAIMRAESLDRENGGRANVWQTVQGDRFGIGEVEENMAMELLFKEKVIGAIDSLSKEDFWTYGKITLNENAGSYTDFFSAVVCEDGFDETKFDRALLEDENWSIRAGGKVKGIFLPAIYENGDIAFRYR